MLHYTQLAISAPLVHKVESEDNKPISLTTCIFKAIVSTELLSHMPVWIIT